MKFINFAVVKFSLFLVLGILMAHFFPIPFFSLSILIAVFILLFILWWTARKQLIQHIYFGISSYVCFFIVGILCYQMKMPDYQPRHYYNSSLDDSYHLIQIKIIQNLKADKFNTKYFGIITAVDGKIKTGKILLNIKKDSSITTFLSDENILVYSVISRIQKPQNPYQFDYSRYMELQGVHGQLRFSEEDIITRSSGRKTVFGTAQNIRSAVIEKLRKSNMTRDELSILQALVLGEKKDIDPELYNNYAAAGAVHILAVSGLHVGILFVILAFLFKPIRRIRFGIYFHSIVVVLLLWGFAVLSGLSPSVTRAVTMFSFFALATLLNRKTNAINTLFLSLLLLLIINPLWLFHVGFQLSYLAVFFIVFLNPIFKRVGYSRYWLLRKIWSIVSVTLSAQIGVLPLSLYYFHQFPGLFLLTNLVILPFLSILMCGGLVVVFLAIINSLPDWLSEWYNVAIEGLNSFIYWIAGQDKFLFQEIHFSLIKVLSVYLFIFAVSLYFMKLNYSRMAITLLSISLILAVFNYEVWNTSANQLIVFHKNMHTLLGYKTERKFILFKKDPTINFRNNPLVKSIIPAQNISSYSEEKIPEIFQYNNKKFLFLDSLGTIPKRKEIHTVILTQSPKVNLNRLIDSLRPSRIIADGNNYKTYVNRWKKTCELKKLPFYSTSEQGALIIE